jgi:2-aminobenzoate-CoA ligase
MSHAAIRIQRRIEWSDTDASGYYHNTSAFRMIEWAETALFDSLGIIDVYGRLPRVHIDADFKAPLEHRDIVDVDLEVVDVGRSSITYRAEFRARGRLCVSVNFTAALLDERRRPQRWPEERRRLLLTAGRQPPELLVRGDAAAAAEDRAGAGRRVDNVEP